MATDDWPKAARPALVHTGQSHIVFCAACGVGFTWAMASSVIRRCFPAEHRMFHRHPNDPRFVIDPVLAYAVAEAKQSGIAAHVDGVGPIPVRCPVLRVMKNAPGRGGGPSPVGTPYFRLTRSERRPLVGTALVGYLREHEDRDTAAEDEEIVDQLYAPLLTPQAIALIDEQVAAWGDFASFVARDETEAFLLGRVAACRTIIKDGAFYQVALETDYGLNLLARDMNMSTEATRVAVTQELAEMDLPAKRAEFDNHARALVAYRLAKEGRI